MVVWVKLIFSITDTTEYYDFYSPVGFDIICKLRVEAKESSEKMAAMRLWYMKEDIKCASKLCVRSVFQNNMEEYLYYRSDCLVEFP